ncbi:MAG: hypothetical protein GY810_25675 [Aureispira sp.]|nr:hypothetical protein [Aureispira sp.]
MKKLLAIIVLTICWTAFPIQYSSSEVVYETVGSYQELPREPTKKVKKRKHKRKRYKKRRHPNGMKQTNRDRRKTLGVLGLIGGAAIFSLGASFIGVFVQGILFGTLPLGWLIVIITLLLVGAAMIISGVELAGLPHTENIKKRRKRRFGIFAIISGGLAILAAFSFLGTMILELIQAAIAMVTVIFPPILFVIIAMLLLFGLLMLLDGVYAVDKTYTIYADDPDLNRERRKWPMILNFIMAGGFAILTLFLFLFGGWLIALAGLAICIAALIMALIKLSKLKKKD